MVERLDLVAKLSRMRQTDQTRIQLRITDEEMQTAVCLSLTQLGGDAHHGSCTPISLREGAEQAVEQGHRRMITLSEDPADAVDETAGMFNYESCVDPQRAIGALSPVLRGSRTRGLHLDLEKAAEGPNTDSLFNTCETIADHILWFCCTGTQHSRIS